jgi:hypothetical protein
MFDKLKIECDPNGYVRSNLKMNAIGQGLPMDLEHISMARNPAFRDVFEVAFYYGGGPMPDLWLAHYPDLLELKNAIEIIERYENTH